MKYLVSLLVPLTLITLSFNSLEAAKKSGTIENKVVSVGEPFVISLEANPSTGYSWMPDFNKEYLELQNEEYIRPHKPLPGAPATKQYKFLALKPGKTTIKMNYARPWERQRSAQEKIFKITIVNNIR